jgi:hypothetical protein
MKKRDFTLEQKLAVLKEVSENGGMSKKVYKTQSSLFLYNEILENIISYGSGL